MKNLIMFFSLLFSIAITNQSCTNNSDSTNGIVTGFVTDGFTGSRMQGVDVTIMGKISAQTQTGSNGEFRFPEVPPGEYEIQANAVGYEPDNRSVTVQAGGIGNVDLTLRQGGDGTVGNDCFSISNQNLNFGVTLNEMQVTVTNLKGLSQTLTFDVASYPWIVLSPSASQTLQPGGTAVWTVKVNRGQLTAPVTATIPVNTASNSGGCNGFTLKVDVQM